MSRSIDRTTAALLGLAALLGALSVSAIAAVGPLATPIIRTGWTSGWLAVGATAAFILGEALLVRMRFRSEAHDFNLTDIPLAIGLFLLPPAGLAAVALAAALVTRIARRQHPVKALVNLSLSAVETASAAATFRLVLALLAQSAPMAPGTPLQPAHWLAATVALVVANTVSGAAVGALISVVERRSTVATTMHALPLTMTMTTANATVALACLTQFAVSAWTGLFMLGPLVVLFTAYHAYVGQREEAARMATVVRLTTTMATAGSGGDSLDAVLGIVTEELGAGTVVLLLDPTGPLGDAVGSLSADVTGWPSRRPVAVIRDRVGMRMGTAAELTGHQLRAAGAGQQVPDIIREPGAGPVHDLLRELGVRDALVAAMHAEGGFVGLLVVANRLGDVTRWRSQDRELAAALAAQLSTLLRSSQLASAMDQVVAEHEDLRAESVVDELTGLRNRRGLRELEGAEPGDAGPGPAVHGVLYLDLDGFKAINDTHGHAVGDQVLRIVGQRLGGLLRAPDIGVRLGGDEFAILVRQPITAAELSRLCERVRDELSQPTVLRGVRLVPCVSVGTAVTRGEEGLSSLLHRADTRMYEDKRARRAARAGVAVRLTIDEDPAAATSRASLT